ncbi:MAG: peptide chain release factor 1 [Verrucomicrobiota bacterium]
MDLALHIEGFYKRFKELETLISGPHFYDNPQEAQLSLKEHSRLKTAIELSERYETIKKNLAENKEIVSKAEDEELMAMAQEELPELENDWEKAEKELLKFVVPPDPNDSRNTIVEIRAGAGGDEAGIFAGDLFRMYNRFAERVGWKIEPMDASPSESGGYKEITFQMNGDDVFKKLRFESGVHRVQRVPATESQGRIHTSTATVAVLPEAQEVDLEIRSDEIRVDVCRSGGPGGQGVNTTDSAVQITHLPTGIIVKCQDGRSQIKNREKAMSILRARLLEAKQEQERKKYAEHRKQQVGSGDRNEKIRTYNYPQNRITDHRINYTIYNLTGFMEGEVEELMDQLEASDLELKLAAMEKGSEE